MDHFDLSLYSLAYFAVVTALAVRACVSILNPLEMLLVSHALGVEHVYIFGTGLADAGPALVGNDSPSNSHPHKIWNCNQDHADTD